MDKPLILRIEEAKQELMLCVSDVLQKYELNCYFLEPIVEDIYSQIKYGAQNELAQARSQMGAAEVAPTIQND